MYYAVIRSDELYHHGILGQKWGVRRFQNADGSLTAAGRRRYNVGDKMDTNDSKDTKTTRKVKEDYNNLSNKEFKKKYQTSKETYRKRVNKHGDPYAHIIGLDTGKYKSEKEAREAYNKKVMRRAIAFTAAEYAILAVVAYKTIKENDNNYKEFQMKYGKGMDVPYSEIQALQIEGPHQNRSRYTSDTVQTQYSHTNGRSYGPEQDPYKRFHNRH